MRQLEEREIGNPSFSRVNFCNVADGTRGRSQFALPSVKTFALRDIYHAATSPFSARRSLFFVRLRAGPLRFLRSPSRKLPRLSLSPRHSHSRSRSLLLHPRPRVSFSVGRAIDACISPATRLANVATPGKAEKGEDVSLRQSRGAA